MDQITIVVPRGAPGNTDGKWIRKAAIRKLTGRDEQMLAELPAGTPLHARVVALLERIVSFEGADDNGAASAAVLKKLSLGERALLLLTARKLIIGGDTLSCTTACPRCGKAMSLDVSADAIMQAEHPEPGKENYELKASGFSMRVRPLTAEDQDALVTKKTCGSDALAQELARLCIVRSECTLPENLPESLLEAVSSRLEQIDPLSHINLRLLCPECGQSFQASLQVEEFIIGELDMSTAQLEREVHWLAFHYHWSEDEILSLPTARRKRYVELVNATLAGEGI